MAKPHEFDLVPHVGIGPVHLGMTLAQVKVGIGKVTRSKAQTFDRRVYYFFDSALQFELGKSGKVQFIGLAEHPRIMCRYEGQDVFDISARRLFSLIDSHEPRKHRYRSTEYLFRKQIITLYEADKQYDRKGKYSRPVWSQIGVGNVEYLAAISGAAAE